MHVHVRDVLAVDSQFYIVGTVLGLKLFCNFFARAEKFV